MKKTSVILTILLAVSFAAHAQTVGSANIMGYSKVDKQGDKNYSLLGVNFLSSNQTLNELLDQGTFTGNYSDVANSDWISLWNPSTQVFETYAYYYIDGTYPGNEGWKLLINFSFGGTVENPTVPSGTGVWLLSPSGISDTNILVSGDVEFSTTVTNDIVQGLNVLASPYAAAVSISNLEINATGNYTDSSDSDWISLWNPSTQVFETYAYYYIDGTYPANEGWKLLANFSFGGAVEGTVIEVGDGFWYRSKSNMTWVATKPY